MEAFYLLASLVRQMPLHNSWVRKSSRKVAANEVRKTVEHLIAWRGRVANLDV